MIRRKTVFVVGAGASFELGLPLGETLLQRIADALDYRIDYSEVSGGSKEILRALGAAAGQNGIEFREYVNAALRVRTAAHLGLSIDNIVHQQNSDHLLVEVAKIAIAYQILSAEEASCLRIPDQPSEPTWPEIRGTWLGRFAQILVQDVTKSNLDIIFDNISIISFNYDRTIRRALPNILTSQFGISDVAASELAKRLKIFHPYGSLGGLYWEDTSNIVQFGSPQTANLLQVSKNIRTFTEQTRDGEKLSAMKTALSSADQIVFLGFGYLSQNMQLILSNVHGCAMSVTGTSLGLSEPDTEIVSNQVSQFFKTEFRPHKTPYLRPLKCHEFLRENFRSITA